MPKRLNLTDQKFHRLTVVSFSHINKSGESYWHCLCECGTIRIIRGIDIKRGHTKSCGCLFKEVMKVVKTTHGMRFTPTYSIWCGIIKRCENPKCESYPQYGGRGIKVCERWRNSFSNFLSDMGERPEDTSIERTDNNGNYKPSNCKWATMKEQGNNKRNNHKITIGSHTHTIAEWSRIVGITAKRIYGRIYRGWTPTKAIMTPVHQHRE